jgi:mono/diheme cytochrome c family protein
MPPRLITAALCLLAAATAGADPAPPAEGARYFEAHVRPVLQTHCVSCHGGEKVRGGLSLTSRDGAIKGGDTGPALSPGKPSESLLLRAVSHAGELKMPPKGKLAQTQIDALTKWVEMGAPWPAGEIRHAGPPPVDDQARNFWSFRPVVRPTVPAVKRADWVKTPIDAFILAKLEAAGLRPAPPAEKTSLLRRVYYDLTGLPPSPEEVAAFLKDDSPDAYEKVVDRLLGSPHYGERWTRHWLDLVRYAETNGYEFDTAKPHVWRYRDYVIASLNADKPYDRFVKEQIAGDELDPETTDGLIATGFYRLGPWDGGAPDRLQAAYDELDDIVSTAGQVFLGLTVQCARCHDHKIDPFPQKDYYRLLAFVHNVQRYNPRSAVRTIGGKADAELQKQEIAAFKERLAEVERQMKAIEGALRPQLTGGEKDDFEHPERRQDVIRKHVPEHVTAEDYERYAARVQEKAQLERKQPSGIAQALCVSEAGPTPSDTFVFVRGDPRSRGEKVEPGFPSVLTSKAPALPAPAGRTTGRRRVLAEWVASPENPLTARVMVNRIWQHHFGRGIVRSASDFGYRGTPPTHPELLDWLAAEFVEPTWVSRASHGTGAAPNPPVHTGGSPWTLKRLHRLIVTSNAYRMSSRPDPAALAKDPENDLLWRFDLRRLSAEEVRDSVLAVSGNLNRKIGGPSIYPHIQREVLQGQSMPGVGWRPSPPEEAARRSVYVHVKRSLPVPFLNAFDAADPDSSCPVRFTTTQPTQALAMLNGEFLNAQAKVFADDVRKAAGDDPAAQVRLVLWRVTQREPAAKEVERGVGFLARLRESHQRPAADVLRDFCLLALNLNEFVYLD